MASSSHHMSRLGMSYIVIVRSSHKYHQLALLLINHDHFVEGVSKFPTNWVIFGSATTWILQCLIVQDNVLSLV